MLLKSKLDTYLKSNVSVLKLTSSELGIYIIINYEQQKIQHNFCVEILIHLSHLDETCSKLKFKLTYNKSPSDHLYLIVALHFTITQKQLSSSTF